MPLRHYDCQGCNMSWVSENQSPIISVGFYNPYRMRCPNCKKYVLSDYEVGSPIGEE